MIQKLIEKLQMEFPETSLLIERLKDEKNNPKGLKVSPQLVKGVCKELGLEWK